MMILSGPTQEREAYLEEFDLTYYYGYRDQVTEEEQM
jgi:hypothetical protein